MSTTLRRAALAALGVLMLAGFGSAAVTADAQLVGHHARGYDADDPDGTCGDIGLLNPVCEPNQPIQPDQPPHIHPTP